MFFPAVVELSGSFDVVEERNNTVVAVGIISDGQVGCELIFYEKSIGCPKIGRVVTKNTESAFDTASLGSSVSIAKRRVVIGAPGVGAWPSNHVNTGTGHVYLTSFCPRNFVRKKVFGHARYVMCIPCDEGEEALPGFEEHCVNCSRSICLQNSDVLSFRVSPCDKYPCSVDINRTIVQNISKNNLTLTETSPSFGEDEFYLSGSDHSYFIRITQLSTAGLVTTSDTFPFSIDNTSPDPGSVYDGLGSDNSQNCSANTTFSSKHQCSTRSFSKMDLDFTNNTSEISARWIDFRDNESDIEHYFWCIGSKPFRDDIMKCENATSHLNRTLTGLSLQHNDTYYVTVFVCNYAGLCTARSTDGVLIDTTPPVMRYVRDGLLGPDIDFQVFTNMIFGNWAAEDDESGIASYELGWGTSPGLDDVWEFQEIGNATAYYGKFEYRDLIKGSKYYITVKAINGAGLESEPMTSDGIIVGKSEFIFSKNDSGSFFFDTVNVNTNESMEDSGIKKTFGTLDVPSGAADDQVKFQVFSLEEKELKDGTDGDATVVDPEVIKPPKHFKLGNYSFQIKAYEPENNTMQSKYHFKKPITITLFYDVDQMLKGNKKVVSNEVTNEDINPVLLLWDTKNQTWYDAAKTCPEPWTHVDHAAKLLKVQVCHLTQFALFWTFEAENGIIEFNRGINGNFSEDPPHAMFEEDNSFVIYDPEYYGNEMILDVIRRKGSTGTVNVTWHITVKSQSPIPFTVSPMADQLNFIEGQWNSSIHLKFGPVSSTMSDVVIEVEFLNVSGGATFGNFTTVKIVFFTKHDNKRVSNDALVIVLSCLTVVLLIVGNVAMALFVRNRRESYRSSPVQQLFATVDNPMYGGEADTRAGSTRRQSEDIDETSFNEETENDNLLSSSQSHNVDEESN